MQARLEIKLWEFKGPKYETPFHSVGLEFFLEAVVADEIATSEYPIRKTRLKLPSDRKRRDIALHLLEGIAWTLEAKGRHSVSFIADIPIKVWRSFVSLCIDKFKLTKQRYREWMSMEPEKLMKEFGIIELSNALGESGYA